MSSLWVKCVKNNKMPSPAKKDFLQKNLLSHQITYTHTPVKRMPLFISRRSLMPKSTSGSMTIEAAFLIPLFLFVFIHLASVMEMLRFHGKLEAALWNVGNRAVLYTDTFEKEVELLPDAALSYLIIHNRIVSFLGKDYVEEAPLVHASAGLNYLRSEYLDENECVDIIVTYQVEPITSVFPFSYRRMSNRYYARAWTGYDVASERKVQRYVYVTAKGEVWHGDPECSYIYHKVLEVPLDRIADMRNEQGRGYEICSFCKDCTSGPTVYYTETGEKYHFIENCNAIHKDIRAIAWDEDLPYRACSRCGL